MWVSYTEPVTSWRNNVYINSSALTDLFAGNRGDSDLAVNHKVLMVDEGGTLELHGKKKLSWTKLNRTAHKLENTGDLLYDHIVRIA